MPYLPDMDQERVLLSRTSAARALDCSLPTIARRIRDGVLPIVKIGSLTRIPKSAIDELVARAAPRRARGDGESIAEIGDAQFAAERAREDGHA